MKLTLDFWSDAASRLSVVSDGTNSATYSYLANSMLVSNIVFAHSGTTKMTTTKSYDNLNRLTSILSSNASSAVLDSHGYAYNSANQRTSVTNADGTYWVYGYDNLGQVVSGIKHWGDGSVVAGQQFDYAFDDIGNRTSTAAGGDQFGGNQRLATYSANSLNQYASRTVPGAVDVIGSATNLATVTANNMPAYRHSDYFRVELPLANASGAVWQSVTNLAVLNQGTNADIIDTNIGNVFLPAATETFIYDADGNLTQDGRWTYQWDGENRLVNMTGLTGNPSGSKLKLDFVYDYRGRRIQKTVSTLVGGSYSPQNTNRFAYEGWNLRAILDSQSSILSLFMWGLDLSGSMQGAGGVGGLLAITQYAPISLQQFVGYDGNGDVTALVDASSAAIAGRYEYGPFGEGFYATGSAAVNPFRFSTKYQDSESDFVYYGQRYFNTSTGRWLNRDPLNVVPDTESRYELLLSCGQSENAAYAMAESVENSSEYVFVRNAPSETYDFMGLCVPLPDSGKGTLDKDLVHAISRGGRPSTLTFKVCCPDLYPYLNWWGVTAIPPAPWTPDVHPFPSGWSTYSPPFGTGPCYTIVIDVPSRTAFLHSSDTERVRIVGGCCCQVGHNYRSDPQPPSSKPSAKTQP